MNPKIKVGRRAFTLLELLVIIAVIAILAAILLPTKSGPSPTRRVPCMSNQRQILVGLIIFSDDHRDVFPANVSITNGGAMEPMLEGNVVPCYSAITNVVLNLEAFLCPSDKLRIPAKPGLPTARTNVSYFISLDASLSNSPTDTILTGDRHMAVNAKPVEPGLFQLSTNQGAAWTTELHCVRKTATGGVVGFVDGHAEWIPSKSLSGAIARQKLSINRLAFP